MNTLGIIPARYHSTRLPQKMVRMIAGKPLIQRVWERCRQAKKLTDLVIATDHEEIMKVVRSFGGTAVMTDPNHQSGSDRAVEVARDRKCDVVINIQGDEPFIEPGAIDALAVEFEKDAALKVATLCFKDTDQKKHMNPNVVKVVKDRNGYALYFSRAPIPFDRDQKRQVAFFKHIGIYAYRRDFLLTYSQLPASSLEQYEKLEQLRALEAGERMKVVETSYDSIGIDTEEDLKAAEERAIKMKL